MLVQQHYQEVGVCSASEWVYASLTLRNVIVVNSLSAYTGDLIPKLSLSAAALQHVLKSLF